MKIKDILSQVRGFKYMIDQMEMYSPLGKSYLMHIEWSMNSTELMHEWSMMERVLMIRSLEPKQLKSLHYLLMQLVDIKGSLKSLKDGQILCDIDLYEVKKFALISEKIRQEIQSIFLLEKSEVFPVDPKHELIVFPSLNSVIDALDPDGQRIAAFHVYDSYSPVLARMRKAFKAEKDALVKAELYAKMQEIENQVREEISDTLRPFVEDLSEVLNTMAYLDVLLVKCEQAATKDLHRPNLSLDETKYKGLFHPQIKDELVIKNKDFQCLDLTFKEEPNLITGINMGGKTVVLRSLALAQYLCQFGFFVPALEADIVLKEDILLSIDDGQNELVGLSSFGAEMMQINTMLQVIESKNVLLLIDELARTTNPAEGRSIVCGLVDLLNEKNIASFITTHYDRIDVPCRRLRVKGFSENIKVDKAQDLEKFIDYSLVEETTNEVPHEAIRIAEMMGVDSKLLEKARYYLNK
ncbi:DNA mismatch repair protein MutS [Gammaproteobacteria bacterium]|nr:DNA mismatch repair protein MutS [Gammaproteobacteria bacterium]